MRTRPILHGGIGALALLLTGLPLPVTAAGEPAATAPATAAAPAPSTPSTAPATSTAPVEPPTVKVKRAALALNFDASAVLESTVFFEARIQTRRYAGDLAIAQCVPSGQKVAKGDLLLQIDARPVQAALAVAEGELAVARANFAAAQSAVELGAKADALALAESQRTAQKAADELAWFDKLGGENWKAQIAMETKSAADSLTNQSEELDQLRKMYKSEELTSATADIVVKRALRQVDLLKTNARLKQSAQDKIEKIEFDQYHAGLVASVAATAQGLAELTTRQKQAVVARQAAVGSAWAAQAEAEMKFAFLHQDLDALTVRSPIAGVVVYGAFANKAWTVWEPRILAPGQKIAAQSVILTVYEPGALRAKVPVPESKLLVLVPGTKVRVCPTALPGISYDGVCGPATVAGSAAVGAPQTFDIPVELPAVDPRLVPGFKAQVTALAALENVLLIPVGAVSGGKVRVRLPDGRSESRAVALGQSNADYYQVVSGLAEGDTILSKGRP